MSPLNSAHINETHNPQLTSWVESANVHSDFPIQNLPFAIFRRAGSEELFRGGVAIGDHVLDMTAVVKNNLFSGEILSTLKAAAEPTLNRLMELGSTKNSALRLALSKALSINSLPRINSTISLMIVRRVHTSFNLLDYHHLSLPI